MPKGTTPYFNPTEHVTEQQQNVFTRYWVYFINQLNAEAFALINLATDVFGILGVLNGGTGASTPNEAFANLSPMTTRGDLITRSATQPVRLPIGAAATVLTSDGTDASWQPATGGGAYMPLTTGEEPMVFVSNGSGAPIMLAFTP